MKKIDIHVHVTPPEISSNPEKFAEKEPYFALLSASPKNRFATAEEVIEELDSAGFAAAVVFGFGFRDIGLCRMVNDYVIEAVRNHPGKLIGYIAVPPAHREAEPEIDRCYAAGLRGAGELFPAGQDFRLDETADTRRFAGACTERRIPALIHLNEPLGHYYPGKTSTTLRQAERFVEANPDLTIIFAHWGGGLFFYELMPELRRKCRNVYYDTAADILLYDNRIYAAAAALGLGGKILFGSDFPFLPISRYTEGINTAGISGETQALIRGGTAEQLLRRSGAM